MPDEKSTDWFENIDAIIADPWKFKSKLNIGKDAYTSLLIKDRVGIIWNVAGTASAGAVVASSTAVASTFFAPSGILAVFGIGAAATPLGWVLAAAVLSGGACYGLTRYFKNTEQKLVLQIPEFISTPLDVLALGLYDLMAPLALKVAELDGNIDEIKRKHINRYFIQEWGYDQEFIEAGVAFTESRLSDFSIDDLVKTIAEFQIKNKDCNFDAMSNEMMIFLRGIMEVDGKIDEAEEEALQNVKDTFKKVGRSWFSKKWDETSEEIKSRLESFKTVFDKVDEDNNKQEGSMPDQGSSDGASIGVFDRFSGFINPPKNSDIEAVFNYQTEHLPTLWLLGKTGAGKSSLIHAITGDSSIKIGNGFRPCTSTSCSYGFPNDKPLMRFLDTRGLGESNYDADKDISACQGCSNALIVVMKAEDPEQSSVANALRQIKKSKEIKQILLVHTGVDLIESPNERAQSVAYNQDLIETAWGTSVNSVCVDFELENGTGYNVDTLKSNLADLLPIVAQLKVDEECLNAEEEIFTELKAETLWYAAAAASSDAIPAVGLVSVPLIQGKMLHSLANQYGIEWDRRTMSEFLGTLGVGFGIQYTTNLGVRQLVKLIPVYGQTAGALTAITISFCSTFAIGRIACKYMYHKSKGESVSEAELKEIYHSAFDSVKEAAKE